VLVLHRFDGICLAAHETHSAVSRIEAENSRNQETEKRTVTRERHCREQSRVYD